jgi:hypothetical protein
MQGKDFIEFFSPNDDFCIKEVLKIISKRQVLVYIYMSSLEHIFKIYQMYIFF